MKIVFMGTPEFSVPSLRALLRSEHTIVGVFTQPDRPKGRGGKVQRSPVKEVALEYGIPVFQPVKIRRDGLEDLQRLSPDLCVTAAFGQILSQAILDVPGYGTVNVHASLLPRHRGAAPIIWAILQDDRETGVTIMLTDAGIDTGDMLLRRSIPITDGDTAGSLTGALSQIGAELLMETIGCLEAGTCPRETQNEAEMTYDPMLKKEMGELDLSQSSRTVFCRVRAMNPWPCAYVPTITGDLKVWQVSPVAYGKTSDPGRVLAADAKRGLIVATGDGAIELTEIQAPNARRMASKAFLLGHPVEIGKPLKEAKL